jgi:hypothetical protein
MKILNLIFCLLFIVSAGLQYNDPDPYLWIPIYSIGALISFKAYQGIYFPRLSLLFSIFLFIYSVYLFFDKYGVLTWIFDHQAENIARSMKASAPWIEETREFFGLLILIFVLLINYFQSFYINNLKNKRRYFY